MFIWRCHIEQFNRMQPISYIIISTLRYESEAFVQDLF